MRSFQAKPQDIQRQWHLVDAEGQTLGRLASRIAILLRGKHKPTFTPNIDTGDHVIVINASRIQLTANKFKVKTYYHHTGYPGGLKSVTAERLHSKKPTALLEKAIKGMLPKNPLGNQMAKKLRIYAGSEHPHIAQQPMPITLQ